MTARRRFGRVRQLDSGRWQARYPGPDGKVRPAPQTFRNKTDASRWLSQAEADLLRGTWRDPKLGREDLAPYAKAWISQRTVKGRPLAPRTVATYEHSLGQWIKPSLGSYPIGKITPAVVRTWHAEMTKTTGATASRQAYALLRAVLNTAVEDGLLQRNPCTVRGAGQPNSPERPLLSPEDVARLHSAMPSHLTGAVTVAFWAGLRLGEVLGLQVGDLDLIAGAIRIDRQVVKVAGRGPTETEPKAGSRRVVHLPEQAMADLRRHLSLRGPALPSARVFVRQDGTELREHHIHYAWQVARRKAGYPEAHFHDLRHAGLTLAAQAGGTLAEVMRRAGHVSTRAAMIYQHAAESRDRELADRLSRLAQ
jgi:integrase